MKPFSSLVRQNRALLCLTVAALGFGFSSASPAHAYNFVTSQAAFNSATTSQTNIVFNGAGDTTVGNPVTGNVYGTSTQWNVSSTYAGNLMVTQPGGPAQIRGIQSTTDVPVNDFTVSGVGSAKTGALFFSVEGTQIGTASVYVNGSFAETYSFTTTTNQDLGIIGTGINSVQIVGNSGEQLHVLKDLQVGSPVPEFGTVMSLGVLLTVGGFAGFRRRRVLGV